MTGYIIATGGGHVADGILMQLLDEVVDAPPEARAHLSGCADCTARFAVLQRAASLLGASLPDVPMPDIKPRAGKIRRPWLVPLPIAAAATFVMLASAAAATPPVRDWFRSRLGSPTPVAPVLPLSRPTTTAAGIVASFAPSDTVLVIRVDRAQSNGVLELIAGAGDKVSAQAVGRTEAEELMVMPSGIRVTNTSASIADYRISVPASVHLIRVTLAGKETAVVVNDGRLDRRIPLR